MRAMLILVLIGASPRLAAAPQCALPAVAPIAVADQHVQPAVGSTPGTDAAQAAAQTYTSVSTPSR